MKIRTTVIQTPCVPTLKDRTFVVVSEDMRVTEEYAQVFFLYHISKQCYNFIAVSKLVIFFLFPAVTPGCSPSCGSNAVCQESGGRFVCDCNAGYQGNGYNCAG